MTASSLLRRLVESRPDLDAVTMLEPVREYASALGIFRDVHQLPLLSSPVAAVAPLLKLRGKYDVCVVPFPATRWQYAAVAALIGARHTYIHEYGGFSHLLASLTRRATFVPLRGGHRVAENDRLASAMRLPGGMQPEYLVPAAWAAPRASGLVGMHTGSMIYKGNEARRWPFERFVQLIREQALEKNRRVRVFIGPNEERDRDRLSAEFGDAIEFVQLPLAQAARALSECEVFVGNDAGLAHLAAGLGVKTIALFGMTNPLRATPVGPAIALRPSACPACHDEGMRDFRCALKIEYRCMNDDFPAEAVSRAVDAALTGPLPVFEPVPESEFRMYGRARQAT